MFSRGEAVYWPRKTKNYIKHCRVASLAGSRALEDARAVYFQRILQHWFKVHPRNYAATRLIQRPFAQPKWGLW